MNGAEMLGLDPPYPLAQVAVLGIAAVTLCLWLYRRQGANRPRADHLLAALRAVTIAGLAIVLLNPVRTRAQKETGKPPLLVLVDTSHSMSIRDAEGTARLDAAKSTLLGEHGLLREWNRQFDPKLFGVAEHTTAREPLAFQRDAQADGARTLLGEALGEAISSASAAPSGGILLISDGRNNGEADPVELARQARARRFPVFTVCLGTTAAARDVSVLNRKPQVYGAPDQEVPLSAEIRSSGYEGKPADVRLLRNGQPVARKSVTLAEGRGVPVSFPVREPKPGSYRYSVAVSPLPGEITDANNRASLFLRVLDTRTRVLVLEGRPTWDAKFLIQALHTDPSIELDALFKLNGDKYFAVKGAADPNGAPSRQAEVPSTPEQLARYNVVVIGKGYEEFFTGKSADALKKYVSEHAGNVVFLRGNPEERATDLQALEPVRWSQDQIRDFRMKVTDEGLTNPAFSFHTGGDPQAVVQKLPTMISATRLEGEKALAVVLARASGVRDGSPDNKEMAVLAYQAYGQGKVVSLVGQGLWRWAFLPPDLKNYGGCYNDFWTQLVRWLVSQSDFLPGQQLSLKTDRTSYSPGEAVRLLVFARGDRAAQPPALRITEPDGHTAEVRLGAGSGTQADYTGTYRPRGAGEYLASLELSKGPTGTLLAPFTVYHTREEDLVTAADPGLMRRIAGAGGGEALSLRELKSLPQKLRDARSLLTVRTEPRPVWDRAWVLSLLLGLLAVEWYFRRRWGLI